MNEKTQTIIIAILIILTVVVCIVLLISLIKKRKNSSSGGSSGTGGSSSKSDSECGTKKTCVPYNPTVETVRNRSLANPIQYKFTTFPEAKNKPKNMKEWMWNTVCRKPPFFMIKSEWPTFLSAEAWNDGCQGCKSLLGISSEELIDGANRNFLQENSSRNSFQIVNDWMRISQRNAGSVSNLSTANSREHWFNPPRNNTADKPLEMEWYMLQDASDWGTTIQELIKSRVANGNWSAFWAFGHGYGIGNTSCTDNYGWPYGGEWDLAESLPTFGWPSNFEEKFIGKGITTGFHNGTSGAFPPCCMKRDDIMYPRDMKIPIKARPASSGIHGDALAPFAKKGDWDGFSAYVAKNVDDLYMYPDGGVNADTGREFSSWGDRLFQAANKGKYPSTPDERKQAAAITLNKLWHVYLRVTTKEAMLFIRAAGTTPETVINVSLTPEMNMVDVKKNLELNGFITVFASYGDFGSNADDTFNSQFINNGEDGKPWTKGLQPGYLNQNDFVNDCTYLPQKPTNWHQNMFFVWSVFVEYGVGDRINKIDHAQYFDKTLSSYMSDIHIRGGGNWTKAQAPPGITDPAMIKQITEGVDPGSFHQYLSKKIGNWDMMKDPYVVDCNNILIK